MKKIYQKTILYPKNSINSRLGGFTLIELLVVVIIIGILAAIAWPQYQVAVMKSKLTKCMALARALGEAEDRYFMANGEYALYFSDLDIGIPEGYVYISEPSEGWSEQAHYKDFTIIPKSTGKRSYCNLRYELEYGWRLGQSKEQYAHLCIARTNNPTAIKVCKSFGGVASGNPGSWTYYYW